MDLFKLKNDLPLNVYWLLRAWQVLPALWILLYLLDPLRLYFEGVLDFEEIIGTGLPGLIFCALIVFLCHKGLNKSKWSFKLLNIFFILLFVRSSFFILYLFALGFMRSGPEMTTPTFFQALNRIIEHEGFYFFLYLAEMPFIAYSIK